MMRLNRGGKQPQGTSPFAAQAAVGSKGLAWASQLLARAWPLCVGAARASVEASPVGSGWLAVGGQVGCQGTGDTALGVFCVRMTPGLPHQPPAQKGCVQERRCSSVCVRVSPPWGCGAAEDRVPLCGTPLVSPVPPWQPESPRCTPPAKAKPRSSAPKTTTSPLFCGSGKVQQGCLIIPAGIKIQSKTKCTGVRTPAPSPSVG